MSVILAILLFVQSSPAQGEGRLPRQVESAVIAWANCRGAAIEARIEGGDAAQVVVDEALAGCSAQEQELTAAGRRVYGPSWSGVVASLRQRYRSELVTHIIEVRAGGTPSEPNAAWGFCLSQALDPGSGEAAEQTADRAIAACASHEAAVLAQKEQTLDSVAARRNLAAQRSALRAQLIEILRQGLAR